MTHQIDLIIFDLFGVVFNKGLESSIDSLVAVLNRPEQEISKVYRRWEKDFDLGKIGEEEFWEKVNNYLGTFVRSHTLSNIVISAYRPKRDTLQLAQFLKRKNKIVVYSNYRREWFNRLDNQFNISVEFDQIHISSDIGFLKPDKNVFDFICDQHKVKINNIVLIDDEFENISSLVKLGGNGVLFKNIYETEIRLRKHLGSNMPDYDDDYSGVLLRTKEGGLILQRRDNKPNLVNPGKLSVFGGRRKNGESPEECALRELREETNLRLSATDLKFVREYGAPDDKGIWVHCNYYLVENVEINDVELQEGQGMEVWYPNQALERKDLTDVPRVLISELVEEWSQA